MSSKHIYSCWSGFSIRILIALGFTIPRMITPVVSDNRHTNPFYKLRTALCFLLLSISTCLVLVYIERCNYIYIYL